MLTHSYGGTVGLSPTKNHSQFHPSLADIVERDVLLGVGRLRTPR
jgi:hypothetical protein